MNTQSSLSFPEVFRRKGGIEKSPAVFGRLIDRRPKLLRDLLIILKLTRSIFLVCAMVPNYHFFGSQTFHTFFVHFCLSLLLSLGTRACMGRACLCGFAPLCTHHRNLSSPEVVRRGGVEKLAGVCGQLDRSFQGKSSRVGLWGEMGIPPLHLKKVTTLLPGVLDLGGDMVWWCGDSWLVGWIDG